MEESDDAEHWMSLSRMRCSAVDVDVVIATKNYTPHSIRSKRGVNPPSPSYQAYYYPQVGHPRGVPLQTIVYCAYPHTAPLDRSPANRITSKSATMSCTPAECDVYSQEVPDSHPLQRSGLLLASVHLLRLFGLVGNSKPYQGGVSECV